MNHRKLLIYCVAQFSIYGPVGLPDIYLCSPLSDDVVPGASQGIGRAIALRLADDGFDVAINYLPSAKDNIESLSQDSVEAEVQSMVSTIVEKLGELNVVRLPIQIA